MTLNQKQRLFMFLLGKFLIWIFTKPGYEVEGGELERSKLQAEANALAGIGISKSLHLLGLAIDLKLFIDNIYQTDSAAYKELGEFWKSLHPDCRWGGDFKDKDGNPKPDGGHFSIEHEGRK